MSGQHCESYDVKRETVHCYPVNSSLLTAVARDGWNLSAVFKNFAFVLFCYITNHLMTGPSGPVIKCLIFPTSVVTLCKIQQKLHFSNMQPVNVPPPFPPTSWLVKCSIQRVRNFKCSFLKNLLLYQLTS